MIINEGVLIAIILVWVTTSILKYIKNKFKLKHMLSGYWVALILGGLTVFFGAKYNIFVSGSLETFWNFLSSWVIVSGLSGYGYISGKRLIEFIKPFMNKYQNEVDTKDKELNKQKGE